MFSNAIEEFSKIGKEQKILIVSFIFFLFSISFMSTFIIPAFFYRQDPQKLSSVLPTPSPDNSSSFADLSISIPENIMKGDRFEVELNISSAKKGVDVAVVKLLYDPGLYQPVEIRDGNFFRKISKKEITQGEILLTGMADISGTVIVIPSGKGKLAGIYFEALEDYQAGKGILIDRKNTKIIREGKNILRNVLTGLNQ